MERSDRVMLRIVRAWDMAATASKLKGKQPDYTASCKMALYEGIFYILDVTNEHIEASRVNNVIHTIAMEDGENVEICWEEEPGSAGKINTSTLKAMLSEFVTHTSRPQGDKLTRARGLATACYEGKVKLLKGKWNDIFLTQLNLIPDAANDDMLDAAAHAFNTLNRKSYQLPVQLSYHTW